MQLALKTVSMRIVGIGSLPLPDGDGVVRRGAEDVAGHQGPGQLDCPHLGAAHRVARVRAH